MSIPFVDLKAQYLSLKEEIDGAIQNVINDTAFIGNSNNKYVKAFESAFSAYLEIDHCIACANGTDSLEIILKAMGIGVDDEVIVPALSWIATSEAVSSVGATPVFVDIEPDYYTIDATLITQSITSKTKAIIPVHLYGHPADMEAIMNIAGKYNLMVIEDCAQAHGAEIEGQKVGTIGHAGSFSFFPGKNLGAYGDAGGIVTNDAELAKTCRMIGQHGQPGKKHVHYMEGRNSRMDGIQAAILNVKLPHLEKWTNKRLVHAHYYTKILASIVKTPKTKPGYKHVFHLYVLETDKREKLIAALGNAAIDTAIQYPTPLPFLDAYKNRGYKETDFPVAIEKTRLIVSIPIYPELKEEQIQQISEIIKNIK